MDAREQARKMSSDDVAALIERATLQDERIAELTTQLDWLKRQMFGTKSEKLLHVDASQQPTLGEGVVSDA